MGSQENKMIINLLFSYVECTQIWLNHLIDYHYFIYITKLKKKKLGHYNFNNYVIWYKNQ